MGVEAEVGGDGGGVAGVATQVQQDFRRLAEADLAGDLDDLTQLGLPQFGRLVRGSGELPVANEGGVGQCAGDVNPGAEAVRLKTVQLPPVAGEQMKLRHEMIHNELFRRLVG